MTTSISIATASATSETVHATNVFWLVLLLSLVALLIGKEIVVSAPGRNVTQWNRALLVAIVPLTYLFALQLAVTLTQYVP